MPHIELLVAVGNLLVQPGLIQGELKLVGRDAGLLREAEVLDQALAVVHLLEPFFKLLVYPEVAVAAGRDVFTPEHRQHLVDEVANAAEHYGV